MNQKWREGYFTGTHYIHDYAPHLNPVFQRYCLLLRSELPSLTSTSESAHHCELGFGQGLSINIHAAANPGRYTGTDFDAAQTLNAQRMAASFGDNANLLDASFEQLLAQHDGTHFDSIGLHGIWTWISKENRSAITEFARRHLKPGGILYNSYNCFPGWAPVHPLRQLFSLYDRFEGTEKGAAQRVEGALKFADDLLTANPNYLLTVPSLHERLKGIATKDFRYLAHEYFNNAWDCMYFTDVVEELAAAKLDYAGTTTLLDQIDIINLSEPAQTFLERAQHPILKEQLRDYFVNRQFRMELYTRGTHKISAVEQRERLLDTRFVLLKTLEDTPLTVSGTFAQANLKNTHYPEFLQTLAEDGNTPKSLRQIASTHSEISWQTYLQIITILVGMGSIAPCHPETTTEQVAKRCRALNRYICDRACFNGEVAQLASPVTGGGIGVTRLEQLFLLAREADNKTPQEWGQFAWQILEPQGIRSTTNGLSQTPADSLIGFIKEAERFAERKLYILQALGVA
ncbi:Conserved hypothetical protein [gamma proteobacterium HdN1]|nr:Conserved hypothetical protein [gamma proteobacterium HdN1]